MSYLKASELCEAGTSSYFPLCPWPFATNDRPEVDICHMTEAAEGKEGGQEWEWTPGTQGGNREAAHTGSVRPGAVISRSRLSFPASQPLNSQDHGKLTVAATGQLWVLEGWSCSEEDGAAICVLECVLSCFSRV